MNRINNYVLNGAIALLSTAGLVACSSSDDVTDAPVNPTYDGKSVKTQFAINIGSASKTSTRMTADNTQNNNGNFLGMRNIYLVPLIESASTVPSGSSTVTKVIPLDGVTNTSNIGNSEALSSSQSSTVYNDVNIPIGTNNFLFYGTSPMGNNNETKFKQGSLIQTLSSTTTQSVSVNDFAFELDKIPTNTLSSPKSAFATYLKDIAAVEANVNTESKKWCDLRTSASEGGSAVSLDEATLAQAYQDFTSLKAGSANAILETAHRLYDVCYPISQNSTSEYKGLAQTIMNKIINSGGTITTTYTAPQETNSKLVYSMPTNIYTQFPTIQGFPDGSMVLSWTDAKPAVPSYISEDAPAGENTSNHIKISSLAFPVPVAYYCNTPLRASTDAASIEWPSTTDSWDSWSVNNFSDDVVKSTTRKIALRNNINYGVACLKTKVSCNQEILLDNEDNSIQTVQAPGYAAKGFPITGIIIGAQPETVGWNYITTGSSNEGTIYDKYMVDGMLAASETVPNPTYNYTLVFDNFHSGNVQDNVKVAIELVNNTGVDFVGIDKNIVAAGQKFYLVGALDLTNKSLEWPNYDSSETHTANYLYSSYKNRYPVKYGTLRVFIQDYTTTANFTIKDLKNAYVTIPDLRASKLQLGLSVDLQWKSGLVFDVKL